MRVSGSTRLAVAALAVGVVAVGLQQRLPLSLGWALLDEVAHAAIALLVAAWLLPAWGGRPLLVAVVAAIAIDADHVLAARSLEVGRLMSLGGRPITHSLPAAIAIGALVAAGAGRRAGYAAALGVTAHVLWDSVGPPGVPLWLVDANPHVVLPGGVVLVGLVGLAGLSLAVGRLAAPPRPAARSPAAGARTPP